MQETIEQVHVEHEHVCIRLSCQSCGDGFLARERLETLVNELVDTEVELSKLFESIPFVIRTDHLMLSMRRNHLFKTKLNYGAFSLKQLEHQ